MKCRVRRNCGCRKQRRNFGSHHYGRGDKYDPAMVRVAEEVLKMDDRTAAVAEIFGGMTKAEAQQIVGEATMRKPKDGSVMNNPKSRRQRRNGWFSAPPIRSSHKAYDLTPSEIRNMTDQRAIDLALDSGLLSVEGGRVDPRYITIAGRTAKDLLRQVNRAGHNPRRRNPSKPKNYIRQRIWRTKKRGAKASKRGRRQYKLKHGGRAIFAYPRGKRSSRKLYELLIPKNRSRSRK